MAHILDILKQGFGATPSGGGPGNPIDISKYLFANQLFPQQEFLRGAQGQSTFMSPEQVATLFRQLTSPGAASIEESFGRASRGATANFASRGQLFGGSLTGTQAQLGVGRGRALSDLFANVGGQIGTLDLQLGAQRQMQATQLLQALLSQILGGEYGVQAARAGRPPASGGGLSGLLGLGGVLLGNPGLFAKAT